jgi:hypothetical protein
MVGEIDIADHFPSTAVAEVASPSSNISDMIDSSSKAYWRDFGESMIQTERIPFAGLENHTWQTTLTN